MKTMIAIPCMDQVHTDFFRSCVGLQTSGQIQWTTCQGSLIYESRHKLADIALAGDFDRILWLDSDMVFDPSLFMRLSEHLDQGREMVSGIYFGRKNPIRPIIYRRCEPELVQDGIRPAAEPWDDYPADSVFPIAACGFGAVMMSVPMLQRVKAAYPIPFFPVDGFGEDLAFCLRARELGVTIWCDSGIKLGHTGIAIYNEAVYQKIQSAKE